jgi:2Fe-2S iron-sulfur cluster binding domain
VTRRILDHPVLGPLDERPTVHMMVDGRGVEAREGEPIAAALVAAGVRVFRTTSKRGEPRQLFCGIGRCTDCVMLVDGQPNVRTCVTPVREGMRVETQHGRGAWERPRGASTGSRPSGVTAEKWAARGGEAAP